MEAPGPARGDEVDPPRLGRAALVAAAAVLLGLVPWFVGWCWTPAGHEFLWTRQVNLSDLAAVQAFVERAGAGEQPPTNPYQPEPPAAALPRPIYQLLGLLRAAGLPSLAGLLLARLALGFLFLLALYRLACLVLPGERARWTGCALAALGSGVSWARTLVTGQPGGWADALQPEATAWSSLLDLPHLQLGLVCLLELARASIVAARAPGPREARRPALVAALAAGVALPDQPFLGPILLGLTLLAPLCLSPRASWAWRLPGGLGLVGLGLLPGALGLQRGLLREPGYAAWSAGVEHPGVLALLLGAAPLWLLAAIGAWRGPVPERGARRLLLAWALVSLGLACLPLPQARRLVEGWTVPLGLLGAGALEALRARWPARRWIPPLVLGLACAGSLDLVRRQLVAYREPGLRWAFYQPVARWELLRRVRALVGPDDVVVADGGTSLWLPVLAGCRTVHGHPHQGLAPPGRLEAIAAALEAAAREGRPPRFQGELARVRAVVAVNAGGRGLRTVLLGPGPTGAGPRVVWAGLPAWAPPALEDPEAAVWLVPAAER